MLELTEVLKRPHNGVIFAQISEIDSRTKSFDVFDDL